MDDQQNLVADAPGVSTVVSALLDRLADSEENVERIIVEQGSPTEYACRVYYVGAEDFDGFILRF